MTPGRTNDVRFKKNFKIKFHFRKRGKLDFVQLNSWALNNLRDIKKINKPTHINISDYRFFYKIERESMQDWDNDISFYYKIPNEFKEKEPVVLDLNLPKMYQTHPGNVFYPVQMYEKYPEFIKSESGYCFTAIYSKKEIAGFNFTIFSLGKMPALCIKINGVKKVIPESELKGVVTNYHVNDFSKKRMNYQSIYDIEIYPKDKLKKSKIPEYFVVFKSLFKKNSPKKNYFKLEIDDRMEIPPMFSRSKYPEWIAKFFRDTSINLVLYNYVNTMWLERNTDESMFFNESHVFPLDPGNYILEIIGEPIVNGKTVIDNAVIQYDIFSTEGKMSRSFDVKDISNSKYPIDIKSSNGPVFMKLRFKKFRESNILLKRVSIRPNLINYLQNNYSD